MSLDKEKDTSNMNSMSAMNSVSNLSVTGNKTVSRELSMLEDSSESSSSSEDINKILEWVSQLKDPNQRVNSLIQLSKKREAFADLAVYLWYTPGVICVL
jgi:hypothetical protein